MKWVKEFLKSDPDARRENEKIHAQLEREKKTLGPLKVKRISELIESGESIKEKWDPALKEKYADGKLFRYRLARTYRLKRSVRDKTGKVLPEELVMEAKISGLIVRWDYMKDGEWLCKDVTIGWQHEFGGVALQSPPPALAYRVLKWTEAGGVKPGVLVLNDRESYAEQFNKTYASNIRPSPKPEVIDFDKNLVVAIYWGIKSTTGYYVSIKSVTGDEKEVVVTVRTETPQGASGAAMTGPAGAVVAPRSTKVKVIVEGDRVSGDFSDLKTEKLEIVVK